MQLLICSAGASRGFKSAQVAGVDETVGENDQ